MFSELIYLNAEEHLVRNFNKVETHPKERAHDSFFFLQNCGRTFIGKRWTRFLGWMESKLGPSCSAGVSTPSDEPEPAHGRRGR
jgi:hypothetical protein